MQNTPAVPASPFTNDDRSEYSAWVFAQPDPTEILSKLLTWMLSAAGDQPRIAMELRGFRAVEAIVAAHSAPAATCPAPQVTHLTLHGRGCSSWSGAACNCLMLLADENNSQPNA